ncbi:cyclic nucleotide-binding domain-containing protein [Pseudomonadota bacterium]|jgi:CRP-like cAMP-binding protein
MKFLELFRGREDLLGFPAQTVIFTEGAPVDVMYVIVSGEVELTLHGERLGVEGEGGIIGEMALIRSATRNATATALTDVKLARLDRKQFERLISENSKFALHVMSTLANRLRAVDKYITSHMIDD